MERQNNSYTSITVPSLLTYIRILALDSFQELIALPLGISWIPHIREIPTVKDLV